MSLILTCKEAHKLASEGLDRTLSMTERARMHMHLTVCEACRNFNGQMQMLRQAMQKLTPVDQKDEEGP